MHNRITKIKKRAKRYLKDDFNYRSIHAKVHSKHVFLESFDGTSQTCNPLAIFEYLISHPDYKSYHFTWSYRGENPQGFVWSKYSQRKNVSWVRHGSHDYYKKLASSKYLISNSTFPHQFTKNENQIYLNTWHGTPLKKMGYDIPLGVPSTRNVIRNLMAADYLLSTSDFMTNEIWRKSFKLEGLFQGQVLELGSPRIDKQVSGNIDLAKLRTVNGLDEHDSRQVVLYAPTWRGNSPADIVDSGQSLFTNYQSLVATLDPSKYVVLLKVHQLALRAVDDILLKDVHLVDNSVPTNLILPLVSHLVTDESSIAFDYLVHDRPVHFYFSEEATADERGLYFDKKDLPGSVSFDISETAQAIIDSDNFDAHRDVRSVWKNRYLSHDDGSATSRIVNAVFQQDFTGITRHDMSVSGNKQRVLIHVGSLIANGITTAAINAANELAEQGHDVSILYPFSKNENQLAKVYDFSSKIRHFPRVGTIALPIESRRAYRRYLSEGGRRARNVDIEKMRTIFSREWVRCFGDAEFDTIIAFDGYSVFWAELLLASNAKRKFIWMHNDLMQDSRRTINGSMPHYKNLSSLFTLYGEFDKIVSVSPKLTEINRAKMSDFSSPSKFVTVQNFINDQDVIRQANEYRDFTPATSGKSFVTVGRLSPEKNQARMIRAMKEVVAGHPDAQLYIIGNGPLQGSLEALISSLGLKSNVHLLGYHRNPHALVSKCDYFVFSSIYEGQGLAVIEAMVLGKPIVTTRYNVVDSVVGSDDGIITDNSDDALALGMIDMIENSHPRPSFSAERHNENASQELHELIS